MEEKEGREGGRGALFPVNIPPGRALRNFQLTFASFLQVYCVHSPANAKIAASNSHGLPQLGRRDVATMCRHMACRPTGSVARYCTSLPSLQVLDTDLSYRIVGWAAWRHLYMGAGPAASPRVRRKKRRRKSLFRHSLALGVAPLRHLTA